MVDMNDKRTLPELEVAEGDVVRCTEAAEGSTAFVVGTDYTVNADGAVINEHGDPATVPMSLFTVVSRAGE